MSLWKTPPDSSDSSRHGSSRVFLLLFLLVLSTSAFARKGNPREDTSGTYDWKLQFPSTDFTPPERLYAINDHVLYMLSQGFILRSNDSGATWQTHELPGCFTPYGAAFWGDSLVWLVGDDGSVNKSTDGGTTWKLYLHDWKIDFRFVTFSSPLVGWIGAKWGEVLKTTDGGVTWEFKNYWNFFEVTGVAFVQGIRALSDSVVWVAHVSIVANSTFHTCKLDIVRTTDGGETWGELTHRWIVSYWPDTRWPWASTSVNDQTIDMSNIYFPSDSEAHFLCPTRAENDTGKYRKGFAELIHYVTTDGGAHWDSVWLPPDTVSRFPKMFSATTGWGVTFLRTKFDTVTKQVDTVTHAALFRSTDPRVQIWEKRTTPGNAEVLPGMYDFISLDTGWCYVNNGDGTASIYMTTDGALTWKPRSTYLLSKGRLLGVTFVTPDSGWAVGKTFGDRNGIVLGTTNRGVTWNVLSESIPDTLKQVQFIDHLNGWAMGDILYVTHDAGVTWQPDNRFPSDPQRRAVHYIKVQFVNPNVGWIVRSDWLTFRTTDGGGSWNTIHNPDTSVRLTLAYAQGDSSLLAFGILSTFGVYEFRTVDAGRHWEDGPMYVSDTGLYNEPGLPQVYSFIDSLNGWIVDSVGNVFSTRDAGLSWSFQSSNPDLRATNAVLLTDSSNGWILQGRNIDSSRGTDGNLYIVPLTQPALYQVSDGGKSLDQAHCIRPELFGICFVGDSLGWAVGDNLSIYHYDVPHPKPPAKRPYMVLSPPAIDFGNVQPGSFARDSIIAYNYGNDTLRIFRAAPENDPFRTFNVATLLPAQLKPGDSLILYMHFDPRLYSTYEDTMYVYSDDDTQMVLLLGVGDDPVGVGSEGFVVRDDALTSYPNPCRDVATIQFSNSREGSPSPRNLVIVDALGRTVTDLTDQTRHGARTARFSAAKLAAGMYYCLAQYEDKIVRGRIVVIR